MSWWSETPMVHLTRRMGERAPPPVDPGYETAAQVAVLAAQQKEPELRSDWTPENREPHEEAVEVFSNCDEVELFLNGRSLGSQGRVANARPRTWKVVYEPGVIRAVAKNAGKIVAEHELRTAGAAAKLRLTPDRARVRNHWDDVVRVEVEIVDAEGVRVPSAEPLVEFSITGPGVIAAVDNGDNASHESFQAPRRTAMAGRSALEQRQRATRSASARRPATTALSRPVPRSPRARRPAYRPTVATARPASSLSSSTDRARWRRAGRHETRADGTLPNSSATLP